MRLARHLYLLAGVAIVAACAKPAPRPSRIPIPEETRRFLVSPLEGARSAGPAEHDSTIVRAFELLLAGDVDLAERQARDIAARAPADLAAAVLVAEVDLVRGQAGDVIARLTPLAESNAESRGVQLVLARALDLAGDFAAAVVAYQRAGGPAAVERASALAPLAAAKVSDRLASALAAGNATEVDQWLAWLERWLPRERATVEARRRGSLQRGDLVGELRAVRRLAVESPHDRSLQWRLGELELAAGDPGKGLEIFEDLARRNPGDPAVAEGLDKARFAWRLATLPSQVQAAVRKPQLTRADLATMVYWLVPSVRAGRPAAGAIASDVLDHPRREEIVRVVNFGILRIDDNLHLFDPGRLANRAEVNATLARVLAIFGRGHSCLRGGDISSREAVCALLARCSISVDAGSCIGGAPMAGTEVLESLRRTLDALEGAGR